MIKYRLKRILASALVAGMIPAFAACGTTEVVLTPEEQAELDRQNEVERIFKSVSYDEALVTIENIKNIAISYADKTMPVMLPETTAKITPKQKVRGIYVPPSMAGDERLDDLIKVVEETVVNAMVIDIKDDMGYITYDMDYDLAKEYGVNYALIGDINAVIEKLHENDIYVIARIVCFKDPALANANPDYAVKDSNGEIIKDGIGCEWVNPYNEEVWAYIAGVAKQASNDGFDEIQFDYIRFPAESAFDDADWGEKAKDTDKRECISSFLLYLENEMHSEQIVFGTDVFGATIDQSDGSGATGQNYYDIAQCADVISPMVYPSHYAAGSFGLDVPDAHPYETIYNAMTKSVEVLSTIDESDRAEVRPWLQCFSAAWVKGHIQYNYKAIQAQIDAVYDAGYEEWILWNAVGRYSDVYGVE